MHACEQTSMRTGLAWVTPAGVAPSQADTRRRASAAAAGVSAGSLYEPVTSRRVICNLDMLT